MSKLVFVVWQQIFSIMGESKDKDLRTGTETEKPFELCDITGFFGNTESTL